MKFKILLPLVIVAAGLAWALDNYLSYKNIETINSEIPLKQALDGEQISKIRVYKSKRILEILTSKGVAKSYKIALGREPEGHKEVQGDGKTPEGNYTINGKNPNSAYHLNLGISYPNKSDVAHAKSLGKSAGGDIKIHGLPNKFSYLGQSIAAFGDWTEGCIALVNDDMDELFEHVKIGTPIEILP